MEDNQIHQVAGAAIGSGHPLSRVVRSQKVTSWEKTSLYLCIYLNSIYCLNIV